MREILPRYKIVYDDLNELGIGEFLTSREFRMLLAKRDLHEHWDNFVKHAAEKRTFYAVGFDHEWSDSLTALADLFNHIPSNQVWEQITSFIIGEFIKSLKHKENLDHLNDSLSLIGFSEESLNPILKVIEFNSEKDEKYTLNEKGISKKESGSLTQLSKLKIFIVHGHEEGLKQSVARFLEKQDLKTIIINEQASGSNTIIEQIEKYSDVDFAVVLMTGDDEGRKRGNRKYNKRARQNVILELGYFLGKLGRKHVAVIYENDVEIPSDFSGILYIPYDSSEAWKLKLAKELKMNGFNIDINKFL
ncbi:Predicted nucleotide-binding protein containing TIR-like domain-containing protein [Cyclobacterium xiamenense]|uniref:Predicted nucleotide-binding protein containing TIR-like domain-containing protein n=1 Tax=Cyclobacterium xiamenense TaxID=1297121 RepID=A0A1H6UZR0_9BACT|nr:nucleotide-binding protein [Cyclobacterium xiamenense]SEI93870.1 Predicted nucleotide-binding protein containing TIR-like domain-containing protein [Cyclobacterium xiamenense]